MVQTLDILKPNQIIFKRADIWWRGCSHGARFVGEERTKVGLVMRLAQKCKDRTEDKKEEEEEE